MVGLASILGESAGVGGFIFIIIDWHMIRGQFLLYVVASGDFGSAGWNFNVKSVEVFLFCRKLCNSYVFFVHGHNGTACTFLMIINLIC